MDNKIPFTDVTTVTKDICEYITKKEYEIINVPINLIDNDILKEYLAVIVVEKDMQDLATNEVLKNNNLLKEDFELDEKYCLVTMFEKNTKKDYISFDKDDNSSIKAEFNNNYKIIDTFFKKFINFRNDLIERKEVVKRDDIYQYFQSMTGFSTNKIKKNRKIRKK